jgi:hypothetical protein
LRTLVNAGLAAADASAFIDVERRLNVLANAVIRLLLWQRDAPHFTPEEIIEQRERYAGIVAWQPKTGPYLLEQQQKVLDAWRGVDALAVRWDAKPDCTSDDSIVAEQTDPVTRAIALLLAADKEGKPIIVKNLPGIVGCSRATLYRDPQFRATMKAIKFNKRANIPKGSKGREGELEAIGHDPDDE